MTGAPFPRHSHLRPIGRSRVFRLAESDIDELIAIATRMERRL